MPADLPFLTRLIIEPLDRDRHDRAAFSCGEPRIDAYLKTRAAALMDVEGTRAWVACLKGSGEILGFYAMNAHAIDASAVPKPLRRKLPRDHPIPAIFLSNIGVSTTHQGKGLGRYLLADAFRNAVRAADAVGSAFIILDALSEDAARLYRSIGFVDLPEPPGRMAIGMRQVRAAVERAVPDSTPEGPML